jgi:hypothetical protein
MQSSAKLLPNAKKRAKTAVIVATHALTQEQHSSSSSREPQELSVELKECKVHANSCRNVMYIQQ